MDHSLTRHHQASSSSIALAAAAAVAFSLAVNALVFALGWNDASDANDPTWAPPGWAVGAIWVVLFGFMGAAAQLVRAGLMCGSIIALIVTCAVYPLYTGGLESELVGLVGNLVTLGLAIALVLELVRRRESAAAALLVPLLAWLAFAAVLTSASL